MAPKNIDSLYNPSRTKNIVMMLEGQEDLYQGASVEQTYMVLRDFCTARRQLGWKVVLLTLLPRKIEAVDAFPSRAHFEQDRQALNERLRHSWREFADALADIGANGEIGSAGAENDSEYFNPQAVFLTAKGNRIVAEMVKAAILTL